MRGNYFKKVIGVLLTAVLAFVMCGCEYFGKQESAPEPAVYIYQYEITIAVGGNVKLAAATNDEADVGWISLDEKIATVSNDGTVTGVSAGETTIMAISATGATAACTVKIVAPPDNISAITLASTLSVYEGAAASLSATLINISDDVVWTSSDTDIATVTPTGNNTATVTGVAAGTATVTASADGKSATCTVTVTAKPQSSIALDRSALSVDAGSVAYLSATVVNIDGNVNWTSSNTDVATVTAGTNNKTATVTGVKEGSATITASVGGNSATCAVTVNKKLPIGSEKDGYSLVWYDEFDGNALDTAKWGYQTGVQDSYNGATGPWFWGNNELQYYTQDAVTVGGGSLVITATKQNMDNDRTYKSARILTRDKAYWTYGYFEAKMKLPLENGAWPAFWMLPQPSGNNGTNNEYGGWAASGELDIMEAMCRRQNQVLGTIHYGGGWPDNKHSGGTCIMYNTTIGEWHKYAVEWTAEYIKWYVDDELYYTRMAKDYYSTASSSESAPFDKPFYILFNLAVDSGSFDPEANATFNSARMEVDYVRVYKKTA